MAWLFQDSRQKQKLGDKCPWSVGWLTPEGKRRSRKIGPRSRAEKAARKIEGQLEAGTYQDTTRKKWADFHADYKAKIASGMEPGTRREALGSLKHFQRIVKPVRMDTIKTQTIDSFITKRKTEPDKKKGDLVSPSTVNKELRQLKAAFGIALDWGYIPKMPKFRMLKVPEKIPQYVTPEHFALMYRSCDSMRKPESDGYSPGDWWRALLVFIYMTGWRVSEPLALRWDDVLLDKGQAITRHSDNKGKRDDTAPLHSVVVEHLRKIVDFSIPLVFYWPHHERTLWDEFQRLQESAGIHLPCRASHEHTDACHVYGFHDLRRAFATVNAGNMSADALQKLMRHKSYSTTQGYINLADQVNRAVDNLHVPEVLQEQETKR